MSNSINFFKIPSNKSKKSNNITANVYNTSTQFNYQDANENNTNIPAEQEIINSYDPDGSFDRNIDGKHEEDINGINSNQLINTFENDTHSETSSFKPTSITDSQYLSDSFKVMEMNNRNGFIPSERHIIPANSETSKYKRKEVISSITGSQNLSNRFKVMEMNNQNGFIPSERQFHMQPSIAHIIPANFMNRNVISDQNTMFNPSSTSSLTAAVSKAAVALGNRSLSVSVTQKTRSESGSASTSSSYLQVNNMIGNSKCNFNSNTAPILLSSLSSSVLPLQEAESSRSRLVSESLSASTSTSTAISSYIRPKSTHSDDKKELTYTFNLIKILQAPLPQFQSLSILFDYIIKSLHSLHDKIKLDHNNKIQHCLKYEENLPIIINHLKDIQFLPENYDSLQYSSFLAYIINQANTSSRSVNATKSTIGLNISSVDTATNNGHTISSTSHGKNKMSLASDNFYSVNLFESDTKKHKKQYSSNIGLINIYKSITKHLEYNNITSKYFSSEELLLVTEIFNATELLLFPIINNINNKFFNCLAKKLKVDIMVIEQSILEYIDKNINNESFLLTVYEPENGINENSLRHKQLQFLDMIINYDIKTHNISKLSLPFILQNFANIFPDYEILVFSCKDDKIKEVFYTANNEIKLFDADKSNSIAIMHYDNVYKLLTNMSAKYMYTNDSDDGVSF